MDLLGCEAARLVCMQRIRVDLDKVCEIPAKLAKPFGAGMGSDRCTD
jgi:hypothetical protein